jgi:hypothetical protein
LARQPVEVAVGLGDALGLGLGPGLGDALGVGDELAEGLGDGDVSRVWILLLIVTVFASMIATTELIRPCG